MVSRTIALNFAFAAQRLVYTSIAVHAILLILLGVLLFGCGGGDSGSSSPEGTDTNLINYGNDLPEAGTTDGLCSVPAAAQAVDSTFPDQVVGDGSPESSIGAAVVAAVAAGGVITFDCGPDPVTIEMTETAKVFNDTGPEIVIDGGGLVILSGGGQCRILYMNTCDLQQVWTTAHCQNQDHPRLTVQNLTFADGFTTGEDPGGGGAIFMRAVVSRSSTAASSTIAATRRARTWAARRYVSSANTPTYRSMWSDRPSAVATILAMSALMAAP